MAAVMAASIGKVGTDQRSGPTVGRYVGPLRLDSINPSINPLIKLRFMLVKSGANLDELQWYACKACITLHAIACKVGYIS